MDKIQKWTLDYMSDYIMRRSLHNAKMPSTRCFIAVVSLFCMFSLSFAVPVSIAQENVVIQSGEDINQSNASLNTQVSQDVDLPWVYICLPKNNQIIDWYKFYVTAFFGDNTSNVTRIELTIDSMQPIVLNETNAKIASLVGNDFVAYSISPFDLGYGKHAITLKVFDESGNFAESLVTIEKSPLMWVWPAVFLGGILIILGLLFFRAVSKREDIPSKIIYREHLK
jgi:hypothetical protein